MSASYHNSVTSEVELPYSRLQVNFRRKRISLEGPVAAAATLTAYAYMALAQSIGLTTGWLLFVCGFAAFLLSLFAATRQSRWWYAVSAFAFVFLITLAHATEGCNLPCPL